MADPPWRLTARTAPLPPAGQIPLHEIERFEFYEQAKRCFAVVATGYVGR